MPEKTVAIVGNHLRSRNFAPLDKKFIDIWVFNESGNVPFFSRINALFQMHLPAVWKNPLNMNDPGHEEWLKRKHPFPIYMLEQYPEVPSSVKYPLDEVVDTLLPNFRRVGPKRTDDDEVIKLFTSTVCYAIALATLRYDRIEIYGVEMDSGTEWEYQRPAVYFWLGLAGGYGKRVHIRKESSLLKAPMYGYEGDVKIPKEVYEKRILELEPVLETVKATMRSAGIRHVAMLERVKKAEGEVPEDVLKKVFDTIKVHARAIIDYGKISGMLEENRRYLEKIEKMVAASGDFLIVRQEYERTAARARETGDNFQGKMNNIGGQATLFWNALQKGKKEGASAAELEKAAEMYINMHNDFLKVCFDFGRMEGIFDENVSFLTHIDELIKAAGGEKAETAILQSLGMEQENESRE